MAQHGGDAMVADIDGFLPDSAFLLDVPATD